MRASAFSTSITKFASANIRDRLIVNFTRRLSISFLVEFSSNLWQLQAFLFAIPIITSTMQVMQDPSQGIHRDLVCLQLLPASIVNDANSLRSYIMFIFSLHIDFQLHLHNYIPKESQNGS